MSSFALYLIGMVIVIGGLAWGASMAGLATQWIAAGAIVLLGIVSYRLFAHRARIRRSDRLRTRQGARPARGPVGADDSTLLPIAVQLAAAWC